MENLVADQTVMDETGKRIRLLNRLECIDLMCRTPEQKTVALSQLPCTKWDDMAEVFIREGDPQQFLVDGATFAIQGRHDQNDSRRNRRNGFHLLRREDHRRLSPHLPQVGAEMG